MTLSPLPPVEKGDTISGGTDADAALHGNPFCLHAGQPEARWFPLHSEHVITCTKVDDDGTRHMLCVCGARYTFNPTAVDSIP